MITYLHKHSDSQSFVRSFFIIILRFVRKFYHARMKCTILMIGPSFYLSIENARKMQQIMKIQFLASDISKSMGLKNLKKFRGIQNKL